MRRGVFSRRASRRGLTASGCDGESKEASSGCREGILPSVSASSLSSSVRRPSFSGGSRSPRRRAGIRTCVTRAAQPEAGGCAAAWATSWPTACAAECLSAMSSSSTS
eukprot:2471113-Prymnesium_polylepis.1